MAVKTKIDTKKLDNLIKALANPPVARVGILGAKANRSGGNSNAEIGARHEFGIGVSKRSWLRVPLYDHFQEFLDKAGFDSKKTIIDAAMNGTLFDVVQKLGLVGENVVRTGFQNGGWGKWVSWKDPKYTNNTGMLLVDTQQLRNSVSSEVVK